MHFLQERSKGSVEVNVIITGLFAIGVMVFIYYIFLVKVVEIRSMVDEYGTERHAINLANALISNRAIACEDLGIVQRGILDKQKLDGVFNFSDDSFRRKEEVLTLLTAWIDESKLGNLSYPNTLNFVFIVDLDNCNAKGCYTWGGILTSPISLGNTQTVSFLKCLQDTFDMSGGAWIKRIGACGAGAIIGGYIGGPIGAAIGCAIGFTSTLWSSDDLQQCFQKAGMPQFFKEWFATGTPISHQGLPVLIRYPDGSLHTGRIIVSLLEWY